MIDLARQEEIFHKALAMKAVERDAFLSVECADDPALRREIESLISAHSAEDGILDDPAFELGLAVLHEGARIRLEGKTLGPYRLGRLLGEGGMGAVYLATDTRLDREVALKFFSAALSDGSSATRQLRKEARHAAMLDHPNICTVYGFEEIDPHQFIVMQYIEGESLAHMIKDGRIPSRQVVPIAQQIVSAIAAAHDSGMIHRDIKPGNVIVGPEWRVKVLDFGLSKVIRPREGAGAGAISHASAPGLVFGTVAYMSPEQLRAEKLDYRSDIFSLGTLLFELATGEQPFAGTSEADTISSVLSGPTVLETREGRKLPADLQRIIGKCLEIDKERRYPSATALLRDLQETAHRPSRLKQAFRRYILGRRAQ